MTPDPGPTANDGGVAPRGPGQDIDAETVLGRELRQAFRGYHMDDVDTLLGLVADAIAERDERIAELSARLEGGATAPEESGVAMATTQTPASDPVAATTAEGSPAPTVAAIPAPTVAPRASVWPRWRGGAAAGAEQPTPSATAMPEDADTTDAAESTDDVAAGSDVVPVLTATRQRRRALLPSALVLVIAVAALVHGTLTGMLETLVAAAIASGLALLGVFVALVLTRGASSDDADDEFDWS
jgi:DivIVA domain-containing protein